MRFYIVDGTFYATLDPQCYQFADQSDCEGTCGLAFTNCIFQNLGFSVRIMARRPRNSWFSSFGSLFGTWDVASWRFPTLVLLLDQPGRRLPDGMLRALVLWGVFKWVSGADHDHLHADRDRAA